jgi:hypothetical protein
MNILHHVPDFHSTHIRTFSATVLHFAFTNLANGTTSTFLPSE